MSFCYSTLEQLPETTLLNHVYPWQVRGHSCRSHSQAKLPESNTLTYSRWALQEVCIVAKLDTGTDPKFVSLFRSPKVYSLLAGSCSCTTTYTFATIFQAWVIILSGTGQNNNFSDTGIYQEVRGCSWSTMMLITS